MKRRFGLLVTLISIVSAGCDSPLGLDDTKGSGGGAGGEDTKRTLLIEKAGRSGAPFSITDVKSDGNTVEVGVSHPSGCQGSFDFHWDGSVALSYPPQIYVVLRYEGTCSNSQLTESTRLTLDMKKFAGHPDVGDNTIVHVINGSVKHAKNDKRVSN